MKYKVEVIADRSGKWTSNRLRFGTRGEAVAYGRLLADCWSLVEAWRIVPAEDD